MTMKNIAIGERDLCTEKQRKITLYVQYVKLRIILISKELF